MPAFNGFGHLAFKVNDLQISLDFYRRLGFPEFLRLTETNGEPWIAYLKISDGLYLELFPGGDGSKVPGPEHTGVHHLCLTTEDIEATAAHLASAGIPLVAPLDPTRRGADRNRGMWITDPDGNRIEIMEMAPDCIQYEAIRDVSAGKAPHALVRPR
ncbi:VOC family protein [Inquilinus sp. NPDC058860]|uniref:VOC family protein n=1 Tax=Inquilinus sp. NPDC058860 TaxID=3346652 RepID=UPI00367B78A0